MKNICFITQCSLPIPTTKGGAVETLVEYIVDENEREKKYNITVISVEDEKAKEISKKYKNTKYIYINKKNKKINNILFFVYRVLKHFGIYIPFSLEFAEAIRKIKSIGNQDYYIYEAGPTTQLKALSKIIPKEKLLVHLHWDGLSNKRKDECFSYLIPVSDYIGKQWMKNTTRKKEKIKVLKNCAQIDQFTKKITIEEKKELKANLNIPYTNKVIIFIGRIVQEKGVEQLLKAYEMIERKDVTLLIIRKCKFWGKN